jgi:outer membrane receptor protein involved in Fe transport
VSAFGDPGTYNGQLADIIAPIATQNGTIDTGATDYTAKWDGIFGTQFLAQLQYGHHEEKNNTNPNSTNLAVRTARSGYLTFYNAGSGYPFWTDEQYKRDAGTLALTGFFGAHEVKFGVNYEDMSSNFAEQYGGGALVQDRYGASSGNYAYSYNRYFAQIPLNCTTAYGPGSTIITGNFGTPGPGNSKVSSVQNCLGYTPYDSLSNTPKTTNIGFFLQDSFKITRSLTLNAGIRYDDQKLKDAAGNTVIHISGEWSPRVGIVWDFTNNGKSKLYANYGRYYTTIPQDIQTRALGNEYTTFAYNYTKGVRNPVTDPSGFGYAYIQGGELTDPNLKGMYSDEVVGGIEYEIFKSWSLGVKGIYKTLGRVVEDRCDLTDPRVNLASYIPAGALTTCALTNLDGSSPLTSLKDPNDPTCWSSGAINSGTLTGNCAATRPSRYYRGVELDLQHRFSNNFYVLASYVYSKLEGNYDGNEKQSTGQQDPNINADFDYVDLLPNNYGRLYLDRTQQFKLSGMYSFPFGLSAGGNLHLATGAPEIVSGYARAGYFSEAYLTPNRGFLGTMPTVWEADIHLEYALRIGQIAITPMVDVFNLFNRQGVTYINTNFNATNVASNNPAHQIGNPANPNCTAPRPTTPRARAPRWRTTSSPRPGRTRPRLVSESASRSDPFRYRYHPGEAFGPPPFSFMTKPLRMHAALIAALLLALRPAFSAPAKGGGKPVRPAPVIVVGWDGGDWKLLDPLMQRGLMPNLSALLARGRSWNLETVNPMISPLIWTTLATGRTPVDHGVADFQELDPKTRARLPISGWSRKVPAVWNVASDRGLKVGVVGWWATWPAEKVNGFFVSDRASPVLFPAEVLSGSPALTWPDGLADGVRLVGRRDGTPGFDEVSRALKRHEGGVRRGGRREEGPLRPDHGLSEDPRLDARLRADGARALRPREAGSHDGLFRGDRRDRAPPRALLPAEAPEHLRGGVPEVRGRRRRVLPGSRPDPGRVHEAGRERRREPGSRLGPRLQVGGRPAVVLLVHPVRHRVPVARVARDPRGGRAGVPGGGRAREGGRLRRHADSLPPSRPSGGPGVRRPPRAGARGGPHAGCAAGRLVDEDLQGRAPRGPLFLERRGQKGGRGVHEEADLPRLPHGGRGGRRGRAPARARRHGDGRHVPEHRDVPSGQRKGEGSPALVQQGAGGQPEGADGALQLLGHAPDPRPLGRVGRRAPRGAEERLPRPGGGGLPPRVVVHGARREGPEIAPAARQVPAQGRRRVPGERSLPRVAGQGPVRGQGLRGFAGDLPGPHGAESRRHGGPEPHGADVLVPRRPRGRPRVLLPLARREPEPARRARRARDGGAGERRWNERSAQGLHRRPRLQRGGEPAAAPPAPASRPRGDGPPLGSRLRGRRLAGPLARDPEGRRGREPRDRQGRRARPERRAAHGDLRGLHGDGRRVRHHAGRGPPEPARGDPEGRRGDGRRGTTSSARSARTARTRSSGGPRPGSSTGRRRRSRG